MASPTRTTWLGLRAATPFTTTLPAAHRRAASERLRVKRANHSHWSSRRSALPRASRLALKRASAPVIWRMDDPRVPPPPGGPQRAGVGAALAPETARLGHRVTRDSRAPQARRASSAGRHWRRRREADRRQRAPDAPPAVPLQRGARSDPGAMPSHRTRQSRVRHKKRVAASDRQRVACRDGAPPVISELNAGAVPPRARRAT